MTYLDLKIRLPELILMRIDKMTMANSLEARVPFLDHKLVEKTIDLPKNIKIKRGKLKSLLKDIIKNFLPTKILNRKKQGFGVPIAEWLLNDIDKPKETSIIKTYLISENSFTYARFSSQINELIDMLGKNKSSARRLWRLISFEIWFKKYKKYI